MRILGLNYSGGVGKTTILTNVIHPNIENAKYIAIESINESAIDLGVDAQKMPGERFKDLFSQLLLLDDVIVDVGSSNIEDFLEGLAKYEDSHLEFDFFVIPVIPGVKEQKETISMLLTLANYGVEPSKIKIIFNRVESDVAEEFPILMKFLEKNPEYAYNTACAIMENELFDILAVKKQSIRTILEDTSDYRTMIREASKEGNKKAMHQYVDAYTTRSLARTVTKNLDEVYANLFDHRGA